MTDTEKIAGLKTAMETVSGIAEKVAAAEVFYQKHGEPRLAEKARVEWLGLMDAYEGLRAVVEKAEGLTPVERVEWFDRGRQPSDSSPELGYTISVSRATGQYVCSCPDFMFRKAHGRGQCKHIVRFIEAMAPTAGA